MEKTDRQTGRVVAHGMQMALPMDRRRFLQLGGGLAFAAGLGGLGLPAFAQGDDTLTMAIPADTGGWDNVYVRDRDTDGDDVLDEDGAVATILVSATAAGVPGDGISNGCSTIGISKMPPVEVLEQYYPVLFEEFALAEGSGGAGAHRGGFGIRYAIRIRRGEARVSMVMDHGRVGPQGALGGRDGGVNTVMVEQGGKIYRPPHLSKDQDIEVGPGDVVRVTTPGGGGYGDPAKRSPDLIERDLRRGYYTAEQVRTLFGAQAVPKAAE